MRRPPALPGLLMRALLPHDPFEVMVGDLDEDWYAHASPSCARYWRLALASLLTYYRDRLRPAPRVFVFDSTPPGGDGPMRSLMQDLGYGFRLLLRTPGFTAAALITLALGIGANTAIFSLVNVQSLQPLAYRDPSNVAFVQSVDLERRMPSFSLSLADFVDLQRTAKSFEGLAAYSYWSANITGGDQPERVQAYRVTANTFDLLGAPPLMGRAFTVDEGRPGERNVIVISHALWRRRFAADPAIIGRDVYVDGRPHTVIGVMPRTFEFPIFNFMGDLWAPMPLDPVSVLANRAGAPSIPVIARLRPDVSYDKARAELDLIMRRLETEHPDTNRSVGARLIEMGKLDDEMAGPALLIVLATVGVVLLLACANVANLLLARGVSRQRELAVRAALGAGRWRIARQLLSESLLLALGGGALGAVVAWAALDVLRASLPDIILTTQPNLDALGLNAATLGFTLALSVVTSAIFGVVPALRASRPALQDGLKESAGAGGSAGTRKLRTALVVGEVALSTLLLVTAGLLVRSYQNMTRLSPGFTPGGVLTVTVTLPDYKYADAPARRQFFEHAASRISQLGGVESAAFVNALPFSTYNSGSRFLFEGDPAPADGREPSMDYRVVTPGYFRTMQIPVIAGRVFDGRDAAGGEGVAIVNRTLARRYSTGVDPIGRRIRIGRADSTAPWLTIVGMVGDVHHERLTTEPKPELYVPLAQAPVPMMMLAARTSVDPVSLVPAVRAAIRAIDPAQPIYHVKPLTTLVGESLAPETAAAGMVALFSALALLLAAVGIYGVVSYAVSQQTREFGVRIALGARREDLMRLVLRRGLALVVSGVVLGAGAALGVTRLIAGVLYGVGPSDPATYAVVIALLALIGVVACGVPAFRATRVEPVAALRSE